MGLWRGRGGGDSGFLVWWVLGVDGARLAARGARVDHHTLDCMSPRPTGKEPLTLSYRTADRRGTTSQDIQTSKNRMHNS